MQMHIDKHTHTNTHSPFFPHQDHCSNDIGQGLCVCVCVYVCVREREIAARARRLRRPLFPLIFEMSTCVYLCMCVCIYIFVYVNTYPLSPHVFVTCTEPTSACRLGGAVASGEGGERGAQVIIKEGQTDLPGVLASVYGNVCVCMCVHS